MQTGKKAVETVKETSSNVAASAKSGMDKATATMQEKVDKMKANDEYDKAMATEKKEQRLTDAELHKQNAMSHNAAEKDAKAAVAENPEIGGLLFGSGNNNNNNNNNTNNTTTTTTGLPTQAHQMKSAMPGHGTTGETVGGVDEEEEETATRMLL